VSFEIERPGLPFPATRPYSIASAPPSRHVIELVLNRVPGGPGSEYWGLRSERDLYYQDDLASLGRHLRHFSFATTLSKPGGAWQGAIGRVSLLIEQLISDVSNLDVFLCGNAAMIHDVREILRNRGLCPIHTEQYYDNRRPLSL
jgi:NAD(P)H-flavin reductase